MGNILGGLWSILEESHHDEWLAQVSEKQQDDDDSFVLQWKPLDDWVAEFEPPPEPHEESERRKKLKAAVRSTAKAAVLDRVDRGMATRILRLILDVSSQLLTLAESAASGPTGQVLNNVNGIVLSYRFAHSAYHDKFEFFRRKASDNLTTTLWTRLKDEPEPAAVLRHLQQTVQRTLLVLQTEVRPIVLEHLDAMFAHIDLRIHQRVEETTSKVSLAFEERLMQLDRTANQVTVVADQVATITEEVEVLVVAEATATTSTNKMALQETVVQTASATRKQVFISKEEFLVEKDAAVIAAQDKAVHVEQDLLAVKEATLQKKTEVLTNVCELLKSLWTSRMDQLASHMVDFMDRLLLAFYECQLAAHLGEIKSTESLEQLQSKMYDHVQVLAAHLKEQVEAEVRLATDTIGAMMDHDTHD